MERIPDLFDSEVIVGGGVHASIYCATRVALGFPKPVVLERETGFGGVFHRYGYGGMAFWLNSANRASLDSVREGPTRIIPRDVTDDLNYFPSCETQVSASSNTEYPSSKNVSLAVRSNIMRYAKIYTSANVTVDPYNPRTITVEDRIYDETAQVRVGRLIDARGLSPRLTGMSNRRIMTVEDLYRNPPDDMRNVAVIGDGDSALIAMELLLGQSASTTYRPTVESIDWYGLNVPGTKKQFLRTVQIRYAGISRHLPQAGITGIIQPYGLRGEVAPTGDGVIVNARRYGYAIMATGYEPESRKDYNPAYQSYVSDDGGRIAKSIGGPGTGAYVTGPAAEMPLQDSEYSVGFGRFLRNSVSIFRTAPLTARLAAKLGSVGDDL